MSAAPARGRLCALDDVPDGGALCVARGAHRAEGGGTHSAAVDAAGDTGNTGNTRNTGNAGNTDLVVLRRRDEAWAYRNVCPHFSIPLNYEPGTFWTYDAQWLMCAHHSAMFRFEDGICVDGPCEGAALTAVPVRIVDRQIFQRETEET
ncbi:Rieske (2Fe-2S) protein [Burkholderia sp. PU8-34]